MSPIVDIHCHTFNADDLPVHGFLQRVAFHDHVLTDNIAALVDLVLQTASPGYEAESHRLDGLLGASTPVTEMLPQGAMEAAANAPVDLPAEVEQTILLLEQRAPGLVQAVGIDMETRGMGAPSTDAEGLLDWFGAAKRAVAWATLFAKQRIDVTAAMLANFDGRVSLYTPMLVDLGLGLQDTAKTTVRQQVILQEKISRLSMLERLPGVRQSHVHPFVGFDPRRQLRAQRIPEIDQPLAAVQEAIQRYGFVGVKMYPPMGFLPIGNADSPAVPDGAAIDGILRELYTWCVSEHVPLTVHCNDSNFARPAYIDFSAPERWAAVLTEFPQLHLNLGHCGGIEDVADTGWQQQIAHLTHDFDHVYADVGNYRIDDANLRDSYVQMLRQLYVDEATKTLSRRLMYGSDWYMLAIHPDHEQFLTQFEQLYRAAFGDERTEDFLGRNALRFLGFDDPDNHNNQRLRARYEKYAAARVPDWLAAPNP